MAILPILCYPDPRLHKVAQPVAQVDERIQTLVKDMLETMYDAHGIGLAATQVDVHERLIVIDASETGKRSNVSRRSRVFIKFFNCVICRIIIRS